MINPERDVNALDPLLRSKWELGASLFKERHPNLPQPFLVQTHRRFVTQEAYFAQGRKSLTEVNRLRKIADLGPLKVAENKKVVTWSRPGESPHNYKPAMAFDIAFKTAAGGLDYSPRLFSLFAGIMVEVDPEDVVEWGGEWRKTPDRPHWQRRDFRRLVPKLL